MILYRRDPKNSAKKLLEIINSSGKVAGHKIDIQKSVAFLYTHNAQIKKEVRETILFIIASRTIKYFRINLTKETKGLFNENCKPLKKEMEEDFRRLKRPPMLMNWWNQRCENGPTTKSNLHVQCNTYQNSNNIPHRNRKSNHEVHMETKKTSNSQNNSEQKVQCWRHHNT
jgi:hypothetical protein